MVWAASGGAQIDRWHMPWGFIRRPHALLPRSQIVGGICHGIHSPPTRSSSSFTDWSPITPSDSQQPRRLHLDAASDDLCPGLEQALRGMPRKGKKGKGGKGGDGWDSSGDEQCPVPAELPQTEVKLGNPSPKQKRRAKAGNAAVAPGTTPALIDDGEGSGSGSGGGQENHGNGGGGKSGRCYKCGEVRLICGSNLLPRQRNAIRVC